MNYNNLEQIKDQQMMASYHDNMDYNINMKSRTANNRNRKLEDKKNRLSKWN